MTKPTKWHVPPANTQISLGIRQIWSESSLSAWRKLGSLATHWAHSKDSDQTGQMPRLIWVFTGSTVILLLLWWGGSYIFWVHCCMLKPPCSNFRTITAIISCDPIFTIFTVHLNMSRLMTKQTKWLCAQWRLRSAWESAQSDQSLHCLHEEC